MRNAEKISVKTDQLLLADLLYYVYIISVEFAVQIMDLLLAGNGTECTMRESCFFRPIFLCHYLLLCFFDGEVNNRDPSKPTWTSFFKCIHCLYWCERKMLLKPGLECNSRIRIIRISLYPELLTLQETTSGKIHFEHYSFLYQFA